VAVLPAGGLPGAPPSRATLACGRRPRLPP
jgi:hypothetical protein